MCALGGLWSYTALPHKSFCHAFTPTVWAQRVWAWNLCSLSGRHAFPFWRSRTLLSRLNGPAQLRATCWDSPSDHLLQSGKAASLWTAELDLLAPLGAPYGPAIYSLDCTFLSCKIGMIIPVLLCAQAWLFIRFTAHAFCSSSPFLCVSSLLLHISLVW